MSNNLTDNSHHQEGDLIDLNDVAPVMPQTTTSSQQPSVVDQDNLLDTDLPVLEEKLQKVAPNSTNEKVKSLVRPSTSSSSSIDVEDILISLEDDEASLIRANSIRRSHSDAFLSLSEFKNLTDRSWSCDNLEALSVLRNLDDILNASLLESNKILNIEDQEEDDDRIRVVDATTQKRVEECLLELDDYLQTLESGDFSEVSSSSANRSEDDEINEEDLRKKLRQIELNYGRFLAASGCVNRAYVDTEPSGNFRPHTVAAVRRSPFGLRPEVRRSLKLSSSGAQKSDWVREVTAERRAHASGDCCTGTVVVEPLRRSVTPTLPSPTSMKDTTTWLRSSMRRLRPLRLPSDESVDASVEEAPPPVIITPATQENHLQQLQQLHQLQQEERPVSAPSRLHPPANHSIRSRTRSRDHPSAVSGVPGGRARSSSASSRSRRPRSLSSSVSSLASTVDSSPSCTPAPTPTHQQQEQQSNNPRRPCDRTRSSTSTNDMIQGDSPLGQWPHSLSSMMACLGCTLGLFNISRFAILTIHFGANFIFQFVFLSLIIGLPLFTLQLCLGQQLGAGVIDMWRISPLFQGVGVSLLISQALMGLYSIMGVSWMFVFFRDSFITKVEQYRWAEPYYGYRKAEQVLINGTYKLSETVPDYFSAIVLQRHHLPSGSAPGTIKFQLAFNLAVVWMIVFVSLSKGLRSYGKVIYVFILLPVFGTFLLCAKILGMMPPEYINIVFPETSWGEFFLNPRSWLAAAQECFMTWGLLGTAVMQIASHNKHKHLLQRDSSLVAIITFTVLLLVAFLANTCVQILKSYGYNYLPNSFEKMSSYVFLRSAKDPLPPSLASTPVRYMVHNSFMLGEKVVRPGVDYNQESGYQVLRLATELIPATFAILGPDQLSPFWSVLFYFILILFGIAQQLAIWHCVITGIMAIKAKVLKSWETTITLFSCAGGFLLGLPMATEFGIYVVYFMDYTVGGMWWLILVILLQIVAVFMVRGRPYSGDTVVTALFTPQNHPCLLSWAPALLSFTWNVILPVALMVVCITTFRNGNFKEMFVWHHGPVLAEYWPLWSRQIGSILQLVPILLVPLVAVIQSYRYLNNGPSDILERIQLLYRPPIGEHMITDLSIQDAAQGGSPNVASTTPSANAVVEDPPPKYTPPPSYTTATGARIAKFLRQSIRRSVRRLANVLGEGSSSRSAAAVQNQPPPPDYNAVLVEMNQTNHHNHHNNPEIAINIPDLALLSPSRNIRISTLERLRGIQHVPGSPTLTAAEVASILRSSFRRSTVRNQRNNSRNDVFEDDGNNEYLSVENLVESAAPIGETSLVLDRLAVVDPSDITKDYGPNSSVI